MTGPQIAEKLVRNRVRAAALVGLVVAGLALSRVDEQSDSDTGSATDTTHEAARDQTTTNAALPYINSLAEAAALKAVDELSAAGAVAASAGTHVDPMFRSCRDARMRGYGPYDRGAHVEYYWYPDRDMDGTACDLH